MKLLLLEDDRTMRVILKTLLEMEGYSVSLSDGKTKDEILAEIRQELPDVMLLDVHLRDLNGLDIIKEIRASQDMQKARVVMTSGMDLRDECLQAGANDFLLKPYMPDELISMLHEVTTTE